MSESFKASALRFLSMSVRLTRAVRVLAMAGDGVRLQERLAVLEVWLACVDARSLAPRRLPQPWLGELKARIEGETE